jgi:hypothetical protein
METGSKRPPGKLFARESQSQRKPIQKENL